MGSTFGKGRNEIDIPALTEDASPDSATDYLYVYDASIGKHRKVLISDLGSSTNLTIATAETASFSATVGNLPPGHVRDRHNSLGNNIPGWSQRRQ